MSAPDRTPAAPMQFIENRIHDEIAVGDHAEMTRTLKPQDIELFAVMSGDVNPAHVDADCAKDDLFHRVIAHGMWGGALISAVLGTELPGPGTIFLNQSLSFEAPVGIGDTVTVRVEVSEKQDQGRLLLACTCINQKGEMVIRGEARVIAPSEKVRRPRIVLPDVHLHVRGAQYSRLIAATEALDLVPTAVVHPCDPLSLTAALDAARQGMIRPVLVGPKEKIEAAAKDAGHDFDGIEIVDAPHSRAAAATAVALVRAGKVAERGQITGGLLDGPLAFDNAISRAASVAKGIVSDVAGIADILVTPDLEAANMMAKQLIYLAGADAAGIVLGARVPIILTSRADSAMSRLASCALAQLFVADDTLYRG